jgi:hypothetical protein
MVGPLVFIETRGTHLVARLRDPVVGGGWLRVIHRYPCRQRVLRRLVLELEGPAEQGFSRLPAVVFRDGSSSSIHSIRSEEDDRRRCMGSHLDW